MEELKNEKISGLKTANDETADKAGNTGNSDNSSNAGNADNTGKAAFDKENVFGTGEFNAAYAKYFTGNSYLNPLTDPKCGLFLANVTFEPRCRNAYHTHFADEGGGQLLICTAGEGWYREEGKPAESLYAGKVKVIPAGVKHWHGAKANCWFSHIAIELPGKNCRTEWYEPVSDEEYDKL